MNLECTILLHIGTSALRNAWGRHPQSDLGFVRQLLATPAERRKKLLSSFDPSREVLYETRFLGHNVELIHAASTARAELKAARTVAGDR